MRYCICHCYASDALARKLLKTQGGEEGSGLALSGVEG